MSRLRLREGWLSLVFLTLCVFGVVWSVQKGGWADELSVLLPVALIGLGTGLVLAKWQRPPRLLRHLAGLVIGTGVVLYEIQTFLGPESESGLDRIREIIVRTASWLDVALHGGISDDVLVFSLVLAALVWLLSYWSAWFIFRTHWFWPAVIPWGVVLVVNMGYAPSSLTPYFVLFLLAAMLLGVRFTFFTREQRWRNAGIQYGRSIFWRFLWLGGTLSTAVLLLAWVVPPNASGSGIVDLYGRFGQPWQEVQDEWMRVFGSLSGAGNSTFSSFNRSFNIGGARHLSNRIALTVKAPKGAYLQAVSYDAYNGHGWTNTVESSFTPPVDRPNLSPRFSLPANTALPSFYQLRQPFTQTVTVVQPKGNVLFAASQPISVSEAVSLIVPLSMLPKQVEVSQQGKASAPDELKTLVDLLFVSRQTPGDTIMPILVEMRRLSGLGISVTYVPSDSTGQSKVTNDPSWGYPGQRNRRRSNSPTAPLPSPDPKQISAGYLRLDGQLPQLGEIDAMYAGKPLAKGQTYTVLSSVSVADEESLRNTPTDYPKWVTDPNLQLPPNMPQRIRDLSLTVTQGKATPFDKAKAIETYLRTLTYDDSVPPAPRDRDTVDYFLFDTKQGYCEHFASAMVVMLRTLGIPARLVSGYAPGDYDPEQGQFVVRESAAHTWPEVYFPQYGWVGFEPTPARSALLRPAHPGGDVASTQGPPSSNPSQSNPPGQGDNGVRPTNNLPPSLASRHQDNSLPRWLIVASGTIGAILLGLSLVFLLWRRGLRGLSYTSATYAKMHRASVWLGIAPRIQATPFEYANRIGAAVPESNEYAQHIVAGYVAETFGRSHLDQRQIDEVKESWGNLRRLLWRHVFRRYLNGKVRGGQR